MGGEIQPQIAIPWILLMISLVLLVCLLTADYALILQFILEFDAHA